MDVALGVDQRESCLDVTAAPELGGERRLQILLIDPDPATATMVKAVFENADVRRVTDVYCALNELSLEHVDVVITELLLPGARCGRASPTA